MACLFITLLELLEPFIPGYQRQLNYKHQDGSYSTFGEQYGRNQGNTWLTAFVLKTFSQAQTYIFIDEAHITQALTWLSQRQKDNGCFRSSGSLLNNAIKGGVEDEVTLSAYITIALLEIPLPVTVKFTSIPFPTMEPTGLMSVTPPITSQVSTFLLLNAETFLS